MKTCCDSLLHCNAGLFFLFYLALGASIFSAIESPIEKQAMEDLKSKKAQFLLEHACITGKDKMFLIQL